MFSRHKPTRLPPTACSDALPMRKDIQIPFYPPLSASKSPPPSSIAFYKPYTPSHAATIINFANASFEANIENMRDFLL